MPSILFFIITNLRTIEKVNFWCYFIDHPLLGNHPLDDTKVHYYYHSNTLINWN